MAYSAATATVAPITVVPATNSAHVAPNYPSSPRDDEPPALEPVPLQKNDNQDEGVGLHDVEDVVARAVVPDATAELHPSIPNHNNEHFAEALGNDGPYSPTQYNTHEQFNWADVSQTSIASIGSPPSNSACACTFRLSLKNSYRSGRSKTSRNSRRRREPGLRSRATCSNHLYRSVSAIKRGTEEDEARYLSINGNRRCPFLCLVSSRKLYIPSSARKSRGHLHQLQTMLERTKSKTR